MQPVIDFFILISNNFPLAANVAANVNFYKVLKNQLLMYSYMWNASSNTFFYFKFDQFFSGGKRGGNKKIWPKRWNLTINVFSKVKMFSILFFAPFWIKNFRGGKIGGNWEKYKKIIIFYRFLRKNTY